MLFAYTRIFLIFAVSLSCVSLFPACASSEAPNPKQLETKQLPDEDPTQQSHKEKKKYKAQKKKRDAAYSNALGTENLGNTCFANSVHKLLWASLRHSPLENISSRTPLETEFFDFLSALTRNLDQVEKTSEFPSHSFKAQLHRIFNAFEAEHLVRYGTRQMDGTTLRSDQGDAGMYLRRLHEFLGIHRVVPTFGMSELKVFNSGVTQTNHLAPDFMLSLQAYLNEETSLEAELALFLQEERLQLDNPAGVREPAIRSNFLTLSPDGKPPTDLFVSLTRDLSGNRKVVKMSETITPEFFSVNRSSRVRTEYALKGVVIYAGSGARGHYYTYLKEKSGWFIHDDRHVSRVEESKVVTDLDQNGYLFLYQLK